MPRTAVAYVPSPDEFAWCVNEALTLKNSRYDTKNTNRVAPDAEFSGSFHQNCVRLWAEKHCPDLEVDPYYDPNLKAGDLRDGTYLGRVFDIKGHGIKKVWHYGGRLWFGVRADVEAKCLRCGILDFIFTVIDTGGADLTDPNGWNGMTTVYILGVVSVKNFYGQKYFYLRSDKTSKEGKKYTMVSFPIDELTNLLAYLDDPTCVDN